MESSPLSADATALQPVTPIRPAAGYVGGKRNLARRLVARIDAIPHTPYAEPFVGMGGIFFRRTRRPKAEIINATPAMREMFARFHLDEAPVTYSLGGAHKPRRVTELIVSN